MLPSREDIGFYLVLGVCGSELPSASHQTVLYLLDCFFEGPSHLLISFLHPFRDRQLSYSDILFYVGKSSIMYTCIHKVSKSGEILR